MGMHLLCCRGTLRRGSEGGRAEPGKKLNWVWPQLEWSFSPIPWGALEQEMCHRVGPPLRQGSREGWGRVSLLHACVSPSLARTTPDRKGHMTS